MTNIFNLSCLIFILSILYCSASCAQEMANRVVDRIYLKDGSTLIGHVTFGESNYIITLLDGQKLNIPKSEVKKIIQNADTARENAQPFSLENKRKGGIAHQFGLSIITNGGTTDEYYFYNLNDNSYGGFQIDYTFQKFINRYFSAGLKLGLQKAFYIAEDDLNINVPMAVSCTNYFFTKFPSFFIDNTFGYNYLRSGQLDFYGINKGGFYYTPSVGLRIPTKLNYNFLFGFGINFQQLETKIVNAWTSSYKKYETKRYTVSLAIQF